MSAVIQQEKITASPSLIAARVHPLCRVSVVIPVRNEAELLPQTLDSLAAQVASDKAAPLPSDEYEIILLANNCTDETAQVARNWHAAHRCDFAMTAPRTLHIAEIQTAPEDANTGYMRRVLFNEAERRLAQTKAGGGIIATTDGDTRVAHDWLAQNIAEIANGADAVGGRILFDRAELDELSPAARAFHLRDAAYRLLAAELEHLLDPQPHDPTPRHHQHFNGSFAVTTEAYRRAGGVPIVRALEDVAFYHSLLRVDARFRHSPQVRVYTSARRDGRTEAGLSTQISDWTRYGAEGTAFLVESAASLHARFTTRTELRRLWQNYKNRSQIATSVMPEQLANKLLVATSELMNGISRAATFGELLEAISVAQHADGRWQQKFPPVPVERALTDIRALNRMIKNQREKEQ